MRSDSETEHRIDSLWCCFTGVVCMVFLWSCMHGILHMIFHWSCVMFHCCVAWQWWRRWERTHCCHWALFSCCQRRHWRTANNHWQQSHCKTVNKLRSWWWEVSCRSGRLVEAEHSDSVLERQMWKSAKCCLSIFKHCCWLVCTSSLS